MLLKKFRPYFYIIAIILCAGQTNAQDINFSQFYELPMLRNPALAGIFAGDIRFSGIYRNQWEAVTDPYRTFGIGGEYKKSFGDYSDNFLTFGLQATNDVAGDSRLTRTQLLPVMNFHKSLSGNSYLSAGIMAGVIFQHFDPSKLTFNDQFVNGAYSSTNPTHQVFSNTSMTYRDISSGLSFSSDAGDDIHYYAGMAVFHILQPKVAFQEQYDVVLNRKWMFNLGCSAAFSSINKLTFYADYFIQGGSRQGQGGVMITHDLSQFQDEAISISGAFFYRFKDALAPMVKVDYHKLGIGLSYDVNISKLKTASQNRGGLELTLSYKTYRDNYNSSSNKTKCPVFF